MIGVRNKAKLKRTTSDSPSQVVRLCFALFLTRGRRPRRGFAAPIMPSFFCYVHLRDLRGGTVAVDHDSFVSHGNQASRYREMSVN